MTGPSAMFSPANADVAFGEPTTARSCQSIAAVGTRSFVTTRSVSHLPVSRRCGRSVSTTGGFACLAKISCSG
ncbi:hypothetical protein MZTS_07355 [Methylorubrum zatmanii]|nr:hypothetical protein [Methylorubrum zatmanii]